MRVTLTDGNTRVDTSRLAGRTIRARGSRGRYFPIESDDFTLRVHFLLFGSYPMRTGT